MSICNMKNIKPFHHPHHPHSDLLTQMSSKKILAKSENFYISKINKMENMILFVQRHLNKID